MFLFIQIALTVCAWRRGWRGKALLPWAVAFGVDFLAGFGAGLAGVHSTTQLMPLVIVTSLGMTLTLIALSVIRPRHQDETEATLPRAASPGLLDTLDRSRV